MQCPEITRYIEYCGYLNLDDVASLARKEQVAVVLTANDRIVAAATYRITLADVRYSLYFTMGWICPPPPKKTVRFPGGSGFSLIHCFLGSP